MKAREIMTSQPRAVAPDDSLRAVCTIMRSEDCGVVPVVRGGQLVGIVTDRDIALFLGENDCKPSETEVNRVMTEGVETCRADDSLDAVRKVMEKAQVRRVPVIDENKKLIGIVSMADLAKGESKGDMGNAIKEVSEPASTH